MLTKTSSLNYPILHLLPEISSCSESDAESDDEDNQYGYSILAVPPAATIPYRLRSGARLRSPAREKPPRETPGARAAVSRPYLTQARRPPVIVDSSQDAATLADGLFKNVQVSLPLQTVYKEFPALRKVVEKWDSELAESTQILAVTPPFGKAMTRVEVTIQKVKIKAVLDTGSPVNVVSSKLMRRLRLAPDLNYDQVYGTAGLASTRAMGAYSALPMRFGKLLVTAPAVVLENESYDMLIGTQFLREYQATVSLKEGCLQLLGYKIPLIFEEPAKVKGAKLRTCALEYPTGLFSLMYRRHKPNLRCAPEALPAAEGFPFYAPSAGTIPPGSQVLIDSHVSLELPSKTFLEMYSPKGLARTEPHLCPGIVDSSHKGTIHLLLANLTAEQMTISKGQLLGYGKILDSSDILSIHPFGGFDDFGLPPEPPEVLALFSATDFPGLTSDQQKDALALLDSYADIFASGPHDFGLAKNVTHVIDTGDAPPFRAKPYRKSRVEEAAVSKELKQLLEAGLLTPSQSPWASPLLIVKKKDGGHRIVMDY